MTAFTDFSALKTATKFPKAKTRIQANLPLESIQASGVLGVSGLSLFLVAPPWNPGAAPGAAANPDRTSPGALVPEATDSTTMWLTEILASFGGTNALGTVLSGAILIYDRLAHSSGLSGTTTGAQTTNLPVTLPGRAPTNGVGCFGAIEVYSAIGSTAEPATVVYKNTAGSSQTSPFTPTIGGAAGKSAGSTFLFPLVAGDTGVKTIESVSIPVSTGTAGDFGVFIGQPLAIVCTGEGLASPAYTIPLFDGALAQIPDGACVQAIALQGRGVFTTTTTVGLDLTIARAQ